jgi:fucose 4-O-acetylase-like acetyltransferase
MNNRTDWVDYAKGIGIILVVYGHLLSSGYHAELGIPDRFFGLSDSIIYGFHMPLFFLLAGLFVEKSLQGHGVHNYLGNQLRRLVYPYFIWSILQLSVEVIFSSYTQKGARLSDIFALVYQPWGQFWFIYALFLMQLVYVIVRGLTRFALLILGILAVGLFLYPIRIDIAAISPFSTHLIFFISGILFRKYLWEKISFKPSIWTIIILFLILVGSGLFIFETRLQPTRLASSDQPFYFLYLAIVGILFSINLAQYLAEKNIFPFLKTLGLYSMQIYLAHMLAGVGARVALIKIFNLQNWVLHIVLGVSFALIAPVILQLLSKSFNFSYLFELPKKSTETL